LKIGIFDSGIGGLTVFRELIKKLPDHHYIYLGDTARLPYGTKSKKTVLEYSINNAKFLLDKGCDIIVIACNTASSYSTLELKKYFNIPIFNVIDAGIAGIKKKENSKVGIIGTPSTILSNSYQKRLKKKKIKKIFAKPCPIFVPIVEEGLIKNKYADKIISENIKNFKKINLDYLILGCTHYPFLKKIIKKNIGENVEIIDSAIHITKQIKQYILENGLMNTKKNKKDIYLTDKSKYFEKVVKKLFPSIKLTIKLVDIR
tara:strand:+ start:297 stop:1076 length:780 start_codon:yes stop_codon:yes gene_type:complete